MVEHRRRAGPRRPRLSDSRGAQRGHAQARRRAGESPRGPRPPPAPESPRADGDHAHQLRRGPRAERARSPHRRHHRRGHGARRQAGRARSPRAPSASRRSAQAAAPGDPARTRRGAASRACRSPTTSAPSRARSARSERRVIGRYLEELVRRSSSDTHEQEPSRGEPTATTERHLNDQGHQGGIPMSDTTATLGRDVASTAAPRRRPAPQPAALVEHRRRADPRGTGGR